MFKRVILPIFLSLIITLPIFIFIFWYFNGLLIYLGSQDGGRGVEFLIQQVASVDHGSDENNIEALDFIENYINHILVFTYFYLNAILLFWLILGRFLKVNKPGIARRYKFYWYFITLVTCAGLIAFFHWYMEKYDGWYYMREEIKWWPFLTCSGIFYLVVFYFQSLLFTSKVMMIAIPFVGIFKSISFRRNKDDD